MTDLMGQHEAPIPVSLRDRAHFALLDTDERVRERLRGATEEIARRVLGDEPWAEIAEELEFDLDGGVVQFVVDDLRFRVWIAVDDKDGTEEVVLDMDMAKHVRNGTETWVQVESLAEVGRVLRMVERGTAVLYGRTRQSSTRGALDA